MNLPDDNNSEPDKEGVDSIEIGSYWLTCNYKGDVWLHGPDGDGMCLGTQGMEAFEEVVAKFFRENM